MMKSFKKALLVVAAAFLMGCAAHQSVMPPPEAGLFIEGVPFYPQDEYMCGPAALASVMGFYGAQGGMDEVAGEVYGARLKGTLPMDLLIYAKEKGFEAKFFRGSMEGLKESLERKEPLILFLNLGYDFYPVGHYVVAVGIDDASRVVYAHSGMKERERFTMKELERSWSKTGYSTLLVRPKEGQE